MFTSFIDQSLREFDRRTVSPATVQKAARLLGHLVGRGIGADRVRQIQRRRLKDTVEYTYQHSPFYRRRFNRLNLRPEDIRKPEDLRRLPLTTPDDVRDWAQFLCVPPDATASVFTTAGTTGQPKRIYYTFRDMQMLTNLEAVALRIGHPGRLVALIALPMQHGLWMGWNSALRVIERAGGLPLPVGSEDLEATLQWMQRFEPNVVFSAPSYLTTLTQMAEERGYRYALDKVLLGGENLSDTQRERFRHYWDTEVFDTYGATEIGGGQTITLPECPAFHLNDLYLVTEIVDPETGQAADEGALVFTTLMREAMPLLRYRLGDLACWQESNCWLPFSAIELTGRMDDRVEAGGAALYASRIADVIAQVPGSRGRVEMRLDKVELTDRLTLRIAGEGVKEQAVREALFKVYPRIRTNLENESLVLDIETDASLTDQIKAVKLVDERT